jgi:hypothetical protein
VGNEYGLPDIDLVSTIQALVVGLQAGQGALDSIVGDLGKGKGHDSLNYECEGA